MCFTQGRQGWYTSCGEYLLTNIVFTPPCNFSLTASIYCINFMQQTFIVICISIVFIANILHYLIQTKRYITFYANIFAYCL